jgi:hypothetical protein
VPRHRAPALAARLESSSWAMGGSSKRINVLQGSSLRDLTFLPRMLVISHTAVMDQSLVPVTIRTPRDIPRSKKSIAMRHLSIDLNIHPDETQHARNLFNVPGT